MRYLFLCLAGLAGGVLAGLGMGGGTLTIPILVLALGVGQLAAGAVNLISFLPSGSVALTLHIKNGFVVKDGLGFLILPAILSCILTSICAVRTDGIIAKKIFGGFLILVAIATLSAKIIQIRKIEYLH